MIADDFTLDKYERLCESILEKYAPTTVCDYLRRHRDRTASVILRHDVDRFPRDALDMARLEHKMGICATYYFRFPFTFDREIMDGIARMGHEIGYHYECLTKQKGNVEKSIEIFREELRILRDAGYSIETISAHGGSLSYSDTELWQHYDFRDFGILGDAHISLLRDENLTYFSDTGRSWGNAAAKTLPEMSPQNVRTTDELIGLIRTKEFSNPYLLVHPERWASTNLKWMRSWALDCISNAGKTVLTRVSGRK